MLVEVFFMFIFISMLPVGLGDTFFGELGAPRLVNPITAAKTDCTPARCDCEEGAALSYEDGADIALLFAVEAMFRVEQRRST